MIKKILNLPTFDKINYLILSLTFSGYCIALQWLGVIVGAIVVLFTKAVIDLQHDVTSLHTAKMGFRLVVVVETLQTWLHQLSFNLLLSRLAILLPWGFSANSWAWFLAAKMIGIGIYSMYMSNKKTAEKLEKQEFDESIQRAKEEADRRERQEAERLKLELKKLEMEDEKERRKREMEKFKQEMEIKKAEITKQEKEIEARQKTEIEKIKQDAQTKQQEIEAEREKREKEAAITAQRIEIERLAKIEDAKIQFEKEKIKAQTEAEIAKRKQEQEIKIAETEAAKKEKQEAEAERLKKETETRQQEIAKLKKPETGNQNDTDTTDAPGKSGNTKATVLAAKAELEKELGRKATQDEIGARVGLSARMVRNYLNS